MQTISHQLLGIGRKRCTFPSYLSCAAALCLGLALLCSPPLNAQTNGAKCAALSLRAIDGQTSQPVFATVTVVNTNNPSQSITTTVIGFGSLWLPGPGQYNLIGKSIGYADATTTLSITNCAQNPRLVLEFNKAQAGLDSQVSLDFLV